VAVEPKLWRAHNILGVIADTRGEHAAAVEHFSTALELRPRTASILSNRGYSYYMAEDFTAAERDFAAAISADASYDQARRNLGLLYARQRRYDAAFDELAQVTSRHVAANDVGYIAMLAEDYAVAERYFTEALNLSPRHYATAEENMNKLRRLRQSKLVVER
jgi:Flp pilus assembly protein TadD